MKSSVSEPGPSGLHILPPKFGSGFNCRPSERYNNKTVVFKDFSRAFKDTFPIFEGLHSVQKTSLESMSYLVLPQHESFHSEGLCIYSFLFEVLLKL